MADTFIDGEQLEDIRTKYNALVTQHNLDTAKLAGIEANAKSKFWYTIFLGDNNYEPTVGESRVSWTAPAPGKIHVVAAAARTAVVGEILQLDVMIDSSSILFALLEIQIAAKVDDNGHSLTTSPHSFVAGSVLEFVVFTPCVSGAAGVHIDLLISWD